MKIIFMGTPEFAVPSLDILVQNGYEIVAVITATDKPAGRGQKLSQSAVKKYALAHNLPILQPKNLKSRSFIRQLKQLNADLQVVVAFRMLPAVVFEMPPLGCVNLHGSLLPNYRGAAPINWAVINGEAESGLTTFFIEQKIDTGKMIFQSKTPIGDNETAGQLHDRLMYLGAELMLKTVKAIESGDYPQTAQPKIGDFKAAPKLHKSMCEIDWTQDTTTLHNFIRGLSPYPAAFTKVNGKILKIFQTEKILSEHLHQVGTILTDAESYLHIASCDGFIDVKMLQLAGKKRMSTPDFLRGYKKELKIDRA